jgi:hypothetical protein
MLLFLKGINKGKYVFRTNNNKTIYVKDIDTEKLVYLEESLKHIESNLNYTFNSFTIDGRKGVIQLLERLYTNTPIQLCQFHQIKIILTYTTKNPKTECGRDLKRLILTLTNKCTTEYNFIQDFEYLLNNKYKIFLKEKTINPLNNKTEYTHKRLRSAFRSIRTNLPYLFTYKKEEYKHLKIPNTTNGCDGKFGRVKTKLKIHTGLKVERRSKMFDKLINN